MNSNSLSMVVFIVAMLSVYGLVGSWDEEEQERTEVARVWSAALPSPQESAAINAAYLRGKADSARDTQVRKCGWVDLFERK